MTLENRINKVPFSYGIMTLQNKDAQKVSRTYWLEKNVILPPTPSENTVRMASGGTSRVHKGKDYTTQEWIAAKILCGEYADDSEFREAFIREGYLMQLGIPGLLSARDVFMSSDYDRLFHPTTIHTLYNNITDVPVIIMKLLKGKQFLNRIIAQNPLSPETTMQYANDIAQTMMNLASARIEYKEEVFDGVLHRDVKPSNIAIEDGKALLTDCGSSSFSHPNIFVATRHYAEPEVLSGSPASLRSETYSLLVSMYEMITQIPLYERRANEDSMEFQQRRLTQFALLPDQRRILLYVLSSIHNLRSNPNGVVDFFNSGLQKDATRRYQTPTELVDAFGHAIGR